MNVQFKHGRRARTHRKLGLIHWLLGGCIGLALASQAQADAVTDWNATADSTATGAPPIRLRILAMTQIAVHDALNSIDPRYQAYGVVAPANPDASPEAAVAAAAYRVLLANYPAQAAALAATYNARIGALTCAPAHPNCVTDGIDAGNDAADAIMALRAFDGSSTPHLPYTPLPGPGVYQSTPPNYPTPMFEGWAYVTPFLMNSGSQFRMGPSDVLNLTSSTYTRDFREVKRVGALNAATADRSDDQEANVNFWPPASWNAIARVIANGVGLDLWEHARLFALLNMAQSDAAVAVFDTKYYYNFWRPVTAIRQAADDGNPATLADATWLPYLSTNTPPYPDYTCGLTTNAGAAAEVLRRYFGSDHLPFTLTAGGITRSYSSMSQAEAAAVDARVYGGIHFRTGCRLGIVQGEKIGRFAIQHYLQASQ